MKDRQTLQQYLLSLLWDLDGIQQDSHFHSLQVFQHALQQSNNPILLASALFHDVGKAYGSKDHDKVGAKMLTDVLNKEVVWLIEHHLDLLIQKAARLMYEEGVSQYLDAKKIASKRLFGKQLKNLPSNGEISDELYRISQFQRATEHDEQLYFMRNHCFESI